MSPVSGRVDRPQEVVVEDMREGSVAKVMAEACDRHVVDVLLRYEQPALLLLEVVH